MRIFKQLMMLAIFSAHAHGVQYDQPAFSANVKGVESYYSPLKPSIFISYDHNSGALYSSFDLPVKHLNNELRKRVQFHYSSFSTLNEGFGIGIRIDLPRFYKNPNNLRSNYLFEYDNQIVEYQVEDNIGHEQDLTFFSNLVLEDNKFIITFPSGKKLIFSKETGNILKEVSRFSKSYIDYEWNDLGLLSKIKAYNGTILNFSYEKCNFESKSYIDSYTYKSFIQGRIVDNSKCLNNVSINDTSLRFEYLDGHLTNVFWDGNSDFPLFNAKYSAEVKSIDIDNKVYGEPGEDITALKLGDHGIRFIKNTDLLKKFGLNSTKEEIKFGTSASFGFVKELDLNHDGISDIIVEKIDHEQGVRYQENTAVMIGDISMFGDYVYRESENKDARTPKFTKKEIFVAYGRLNDEKNDLQFYIDKSVKLPPTFNTMEPACLFTFDNADSRPLSSRCNNPGMSHWDEHEDETDFAKNEPSSHYHAVILKKSSMLLGDFNGDSFVDILHCSKKSKSILFGTSEGFNSEDQQVDYPCSSQSVAQDINNDGLSDIISTDGVYLNLGGNFEKIKNASYDLLIELLKDQLKLQEFTELSEGQLKEVVGQKSRWLLYKEHVDLIKDKKLFFNVKENQYYYDKEERDTQILTQILPGSGTFLFTGKDSKGEYFSTGTKKRISSLSNALGAVTDFEFIGKGHSPLINKVARKNLDESHVENIEYFGPIISQLNGRFLGYKFLYKNTEAQAHHEGVDKIIHFYSDRSKKDMLKRSPIHGKIAEVATCKIGQCSNLLSFIQSPEGLVIPLQEADLLEVNKWNVLYGKNISNDFKNDQYLKSNFSKSNSFKFKLEGQNVFKSIVDKTTPLKFSKFGPLKIISEKMVGIQSSSFGTDIESTGIYEKTVVNKILFNNSLQVLSQYVYDNVSESRPISKVDFSYEGEQDLGTFGVSATKEINSDYIETTKQYFDSYGRSSRSVSARNEESSLSYSIDEATTTTINSIGKIIAKYSKLGDIKEITSFDKDQEIPYLVLSYEYKIPGFITKVTQNDQSVSITALKGKSLKLTLTVKNSDSAKAVISRTLDHLGNTIYETNLVDTKLSLTNKSVFDANSKLIKDYLPQFENINEVPKTELQYDFLGRLISKNDMILNQNESWLFDRYKSHYINSTLISKSELMPANLSSQIFRADKKRISIEDTLSQGVSALEFDNMSLRYEKDLGGNITDIKVNDLISLYNKKSTLNKIDVDDFSVVHLNKFGNIQKFDGFIDTYDFTYDQRSRLVGQASNNFLATANYNDLNFVISNTYMSKKSGIYFNENYKYNDSDLISKVDYVSDTSSISLDYKYNSNKVESISGIVDQISYHSTGIINEIKYSNGVKVKYKRDQLGQLLELEVNDNSSLVKKELYERNENNLISKSTSSFGILGKESVDSYEYSNDLRFLGTTKLSSQSISRDEFYSSSSEDIISHKTNILQVDNKLVNYGVGNEIKGFVDNSTNSNDEFLKDNLHYIDGTFVKYIEANGIMIGAIIFTENKAEFHPIITDVRGSVRLVYNSSGKLALLKNYDAWGVLDHSNFMSFNNIENKIVYDFAKLKRLNSNSEYLVAKYRLYNPSIGQWLSLDPLLFSNVEMLLKDRHYEIDGLSYSAGDPINFVDPSGYCAAPALGAGQTGACFEAFIGASRIGGIGHGDGRTFSGNNAALTNRHQVQLVYDTKSGILNMLNPTYGVSETSVTPGMPGNGVASLVSNGKGNYTLNISSWNGFRELLKPVGGIVPGPPYLSADIDASFNFSVNSSGQFHSLSANHDGYPSHGAYSYGSNGGISNSYQFSETTPWALFGTGDIYWSGW